MPHHKLFIHVSFILRVHYFQILSIENLSHQWESGRVLHALGCVVGRT